MLLGNILRNRRSRFLWKWRLELTIRCGHLLRRTNRTGRFLKCISWYFPRSGDRAIAIQRLFRFRYPLRCLCTTMATETASAFFVELLEDDVVDRSYSFAVVQVVVSIPFDFVIINVREFIFLRKTLVS